MRVDLRNGPCQQIAHWQAARARSTTYEKGRPCGRRRCETCQERKGEEGEKRAAGQKCGPCGPPTFLSPCRRRFALGSVHVTFFFLFSSRIRLLLSLSQPLSPSLLASTRVEPSSTFPESVHRQPVALESSSAYQVSKKDFTDLLRATRAVGRLPSKGSLLREDFAVFRLGEGSSRGRMQGEFSSFLVFPSPPYPFPHLSLS